MRKRRLPPSRTAALAPATAAVLLCLTLTGCHTTERASTRMRVEDFEEMAQKMAASLRACPAIAGRTPGDKPWVVSFQKVTNLSSDILTPGEQWFPMTFIQGSQPIRQLWDSHRIRFVVNAEEAALQTGAQPQEFDANYAAERRVTHVVTATYRSATRSQSDARSDLYVCIFEMRDLATGQSVWSDEFLIKRQAFGSLRD